jgi:hypothetical protein
MGIMAAIAVVEAARPSRSLRGRIVVGVIRIQVAAARTIQAHGAGLAVVVEHAGESRG